MAQAGRGSEGRAGVQRAKGGRGEQPWYTLNAPCARGARSMRELCNTPLGITLLPA